MEKYSKVMTATVHGIQGQIVEVETFISYGIPYHTVVGLGNTVIKESKDRVKAGIMSANIPFPNDKITQNLFPSGIKKSGSHFDLPLAIGIIAAEQNIEVQGFSFIGELSLDGRILPFDQLLSLLITFKENGMHHVVIPEESLRAACCIDGLHLYPYGKLEELIADLSARTLRSARVEYDSEDYPNGEMKNFKEVIGQEMAVRAAMISTISGGNFLMVGTPGCGKTMIAHRMRGILPPMSMEESVTITRIYETARYKNRNKSLLLRERPVRTPHHSITTAAMMGSHIAGECSKAHGGLLILDELTEYRKEVLESLREPMEDKEITITKNNITTTMPCDFRVIATMNRCRCGDEQCRCSLSQKKEYARKLSKPFLDRIDIGIKMSKPEGGYSVSSQEMTRRIRDACERRDSITFSIDSKEYLDRIYRSNKISMRSYHKMRNIAKSIAALERKETVEKVHIMEAYTYNTEQVLRDVLYMES